MVHFRSTAAFLATALSACHFALGADTAPKESSTGLAIHVLTGTADMACTPDRLALLKTRIVETATLAQTASKAMKEEGIAHSPAFTEFLGNANPKEIEAQHYAPIASLHSVELKSVTSDEGHKLGVESTAPAHETLFMCFKADDPICTKDGKATGLVGSAYAREQVVKLCPLFFGGVPRVQPSTGKEFMAKSLSLAQGKSSYLAGRPALNTGALMLVHELQHLPSVVGAHVLKDLYIKAGAPHEPVPRPKNIYKVAQGIVGVYAKNDCIGLPEDKKGVNPQNLAYFALDIYSNPARAEPVKATSDASKAPGDAAKDAKDAPKTPKRFEAIYQRRAGKAQI